MKDYVTAYLAYGVKIPNAFHEGLDEKLQEFDKRHDMRSLGYLFVGRYDREDLYLVMKSFKAEIGSPASIDLHNWEDKGLCNLWNHWLHLALSELGVEGECEPGWLLIADHK